MVSSRADGGEVEEEILEHNAAERRYKYRIVSSPLPMTNYVSTPSVDEVDGGARVTWNSEFEAAGIEPAELEAMIRGLYEAGPSALPKHAEGCCTGSFGTPRPRRGSKPALSAQGREEQALLSSHHRATWRS